MMLSPKLPREVGRRCPPQGAARCAKLARMSGERGSPTIRRRQLGIELKRLREEANLTIDDVARTTGKSSSHLSRIERAETGASVATVEQLLTAFDVDANVR